VTPRRKLVGVGWKDYYRENEENGSPITNLTIIVYQATLQGFLHRLYSLDLPLISVICVEIK
jgi:hypothetical protein